MAGYHPPMAGQRLSWESPLTDLPFELLDKIAIAVDASSRFYELAERLGYTFQDARAIEVRSKGNHVCHSSSALLLLQNLMDHNCTIGRLQHTFVDLNHPALRIIDTWLSNYSREQTSFLSGMQGSEESICNCATCYRNRYPTQTRPSGGCGQPNCSCLISPPSYATNPVEAPHYSQPPPPNENVRGTTRSVSVEIPNIPRELFIPRGPCEIERVTLLGAHPEPAPETSVSPVELSSCCLCDLCRLESDPHETKALRTFDDTGTPCALRRNTRGHDRLNADHDIRPLLPTDEPISDQTQMKSRLPDQVTIWTSQTGACYTDQTQVKSPIPGTEPNMNGNHRIPLSKIPIKCDNCGREIGSMPETCKVCANVLKMNCRGDFGTDKGASENHGQNIDSGESSKTIYRRSFVVDRNSWHGEPSSVASSNSSLSSSVDSGLSGASSRTSSDNGDSNCKGTIISNSWNRFSPPIAHDSSNKERNSYLSNSQRSLPTNSIPEASPDSEGRVRLPRYVAPRAVKVFITYSWNHLRDDVRFLRELEKLCILLKQCGFHIKIDIDDDSVSERRVNKMDWLERHLKEADYVLVCITPTYYADIQPSPNIAVPMESQLNARYIFDQLRLEFVANNSRNFRMVPVLFPSAGADSSHVPKCMRSTIVYTFPSHWIDIINNLLLR